MIGQASFLAASIATAHAPIMPEAMAAAAFSLLPDLDKRQSYIGRLFPFISEPLDYYFGHRTMTHSLLLQGLVAGLTYSLIPYGWWLALICGLVSHTVGDMMTPHGVAWFWPSTRRCVIPGNPRYRIDPMSKAELIFAVCVALLTFPLVQLSHSGAGTKALIRQSIGDIASAREDYDAGKGTHAWQLQVTGRDNRSYADISGSYPVIGPWQDTGFIVETETGARTACRSSSCDWHSEHAVLVQGNPEQTSVHSIKERSLTASALATALEPLRAAGQVYLLGSMKTHTVEEQLPEVSVSGDTVTLNYADPGIFAESGSALLHDVDIVVQIRHSPGATVPALHITSEPTSAYPPLIRRWIQQESGKISRDRYESE
jgi:inner membrane protein